MKKHIGLFGGTFDPIHVAHLRIARDVKERLQLEQIRFIPCHIPAHRSAPHASAAQRLAMTQLAIADQPDFVADDCELQDSAPSYTINTLKKLRLRLGNDIKFYWLIGADAFSHIDQWLGWQELLDHTHIVVMERAGQKAQLSGIAQTWLEQNSVHSEKQLADRRRGSIIQLNVTALNISASQIRHNLNAQMGANLLLHPPVIGYIEQHRLYTGASATS